VQPVPKRAPAITANGAASPANTASTSSPDQSGLSQPDQTLQTGQSADSTQAGQQPEPGQVAQPNPQGTDQPGQPQPVQNNGQAGADQTNPAAGAQGANSMSAIRRMLTNPNAQAQGPGAGGFRNTGGGLAGIASKAQGHTIKVVNDQLDYSLWEFYYDPAKDVKQALPGGTGMGGAQPGAGTNTFNSTVNSANRPVPSSPPAPSAAPAPSVAPAQPPEFDPNPNPSSEIPPPDDPTNPEDTNSNDTPAEPPQ
jgi:hypothetical protein